MTVKAIYEKGVFRPVSAVDLPEKTSVEVILPESDAAERENQEEIYAILRQRYDSGEHDVAERHNEHQP